jgi:hypothetical protein
MSQYKVICLVQTVHVPHNKTVEFSWYDVVERTIERTIDVNGRIHDERVVDETVIESDLDMEEELIDSDEDVGDEEIVEEEFTEEEEVELE